MTLITSATKTSVKLKQIVFDYSEFFVNDKHLIK